MQENTCGRFTPTLEFSFSSLSVAPTDLSVHALSSKYVTCKTVENMARLRDHLAQVTDVSISLHLGDLTNVPSAAKQLAEKGILVTSVDRPDVYPTHLAAKDVLLRLTERRRHEAIVTIARRAHNISSEEGANKKNQEGIRAMKNQECYEGNQRVILRTHSGLWAQDGGVTGDRLRKSLRGTGVIIAIEILASIQTQSEYRTLIEQLAKDNSCDTEVYFDVDLGHVAEAKFLHSGESDGKEPLAFLEDIIKDSGRLIAATSLNQYADGDHVTHRNFLGPKGKIKHQDVARALGKGVQNGSLDPYVLTVAEPMPFELPELLSDQGIAFVRNFRTQFYESAGVTQEYQFPT